MKYRLVVLDKHGTEFATGLYDVDALPEGDWLKEAFSRGGLKTATLQHDSTSTKYIYERIDE